MALLEKKLSSNWKVIKNNNADSLCHYEKLRRDNIIRNKIMLETLFKSATSEKNLIEQNQNGKRSFKQKSYKATRMSSGKENCRQSKRLKGEEPEPSTDKLMLINDEADNNQNCKSETKKPYSFYLWKGKKQTTNYDVTVKLPSEVYTPFTLGSIGTVIHDFGALPDIKDKRYWSSRGCLFRHPYPIGYKASKSHFGKEYTMTIEATLKGPLFKVHCENGPTFEGFTPTAPWTKACLCSNSRGTRVSGPLFYGFSDPLTISQIERLPNYKKWEEIFQK